MISSNMTEVRPEGEADGQLHLILKLLGEGCGVIEAGHSPFQGVL